jgi:molybdopterin molybdotransferase
MNTPSEKSVAPPLGPSPLAGGDPQLSLDAARAAIAAALQPLPLPAETRHLMAALDRVLAEPVVCPLDVPAHDNSAMDGYAFDGTALVPGQPLRLAVVAGTAFAGPAVPTALGAGQALRIMTGAALPDGADTVVPLELCRIQRQDLYIGADCVRPHDNRRLRGEDLRRGQPALPAGRVLRPADLGLLASLGLTEVAVRRRLRVALFSTGDELREPGQPLPPGCIHDSNRYSLAAAVQRLGMQVIDLGTVRDDPAALQATLERAIAQADVVLTSGGVSAGDADHTRALLSRMGEVLFWKVAMRPGRPFAFGPVAHADRRCWLFALPGNPVAALVSFYVLAREGLLRLAGATPEPLPCLAARSVHALRKRPGRSELQRGRVSRGADGQWQVETTGSQGAGILRSMSEANALVLLRHDQGPVAAGDAVEVWLFEGLV